MYMFIVQLVSPVQLFANPWSATYQSSLSFSISQSLLKFMPIESVMLFNAIKAILNCFLIIITDMLYLYIILDNFMS